jgi:pimeloyl-ACP methyl ester carboxylesterase
VKPADLPLLFVPGVLGTTLVDGSNPGRAIWGSAGGLLALRKHSFAAGANGLVPGEILWKFAVVAGLYSVPVYEDLALRLATIGYDRARLEAPVTARALYGLSYDWRQDVVRGAREVEEAVERLKANLGVPRVALLAHSWGCTVVRYYLRYGGADLLSDTPEDPRPGESNASSFFALGPLAGGTLRALHEANHGFPVAPLRLGIAARQAARTPSLYQMLPFDEDRAVDEAGRPMDLDLSDVETWRAHAWGPFQPEAMRGQDPSRVEHFLRKSLRRARRLWELLRERHPSDESVRTHTYTVRDGRTLTKLVLTKGGRTFANDEEVARHCPGLLALVTSPGDGYVSVEDVRRHMPGGDLLSVERCSHRHLYGNDEVLADLIRNLEGESR